LRLTRGRAEILGGGSLQSSSVIFYDGKMRFVSCGEKELAVFCANAGSAHLAERQCSFLWTPRDKFNLGRQKESGRA